MKIRRTLMLSFTIIILLAVTVGIVGMVNLSNLSTADSHMYDYNVSAIKTLGSIRENFALQKSAYRNIILFRAESEYYKEASDTLKALESAMEEHLQAYSALVTYQEDIDAYGKFVSDYRNGFLKMKEELLRLSASNKIDEANELLGSSAILTLANSMNESLDKCYSFNLDYTKRTVENNNKRANNAIFLQILLLLAATGISAFLTIYISSIISTPLSIMTEYMRKVSQTGETALSNEDMKLIEKCTGKKDEASTCVSAAAAFVSRVIEIGGTLVTISEGDLRVELGLLSDKDTMGLSVKKMTSSLNEMFGQISSSAKQVALGSKQIADNAQSLAQSSTEQAAVVEELSASANDISRQTKENTELAKRATILAESIKENAEKGNSQMTHMLAAVRDIKESSRNIGNVIKVIDDIAFQTNILALNAAVEAARAGQHGKGFAVVAEEVRNLAAKSAEAAKNTGSLITDSMEKAELGAQIAGETARSLSEIIAGIRDSGRIVADIAVSSRQQSAAISQINIGIGQVAEVIQQNSASAEELASASEEMSKQSDTLESLTFQFKLKNTPIITDTPPIINLTKNPPSHYIPQKFLDY